MSTTQLDQSFDSGRNHLMPFIVACIIIALAVAASLAITGLPA